MLGPGVGTAWEGPGRQGGCEAPVLGLRSPPRSLCPHTASPLSVHTETVGFPSPTHCPGSCCLKQRIEQDAAGAGRGGGIALLEGNGSNRTLAHREVARGGKGSPGRGPSGKASCAFAPTGCGRSLFSEERLPRWTAKRDRTQLLVVCFLCMSGPRVWSVIVALTKPRAYASFIMRA